MDADGLFGSVNANVVGIVIVDCHFAISSWLNSVDSGGFGAIACREPLSGCCQLKLFGTSLDSLGEGEIENSQAAVAVRQTSKDRDLKSR